MRITVSNPTRTRKWGFAYSTDFDRDLRMIPPTGPTITGTLRQVRQAIDEDRTLASIQSGGTCYSAVWFYAGRPIIKDERLNDLVGEVDMAAHFGQSMPQSWALEVQD